MVGLALKSWAWDRSEVLMSEKIIQRGKTRIWYADTFYLGVHIRDCLRTTDEKIARRRLWEIKFSVEEGGYQVSKKKFKFFAEQVAAEGLSEREESIMRIHILPFLGETKIGKVDVDSWVQARVHKPKSTLVKEMSVLARVMKKADPSFVMPKPRFKNLGKVFDETQILEREQMEMVVRDYVMERNKLPCLIAAYSTLRLKNVIGLRKKDVDFKEGWIRVKQSKTGKLVSIPITKTLKEVFMTVKVRPLQPDDLWFPGIKANTIANQVRRSFTRAGIPWASFHSLRHFGASYLIANNVPLEQIRIIMGHSDFKSTLVYARLKGDKIKEAMAVFDQKLHTQNLHKPL